MAAEAKAVGAEFTDAEFDGWTDELEEAQINLATESNKIKYIVVEGQHFVAKFPDGRIIKTVLALSVDQLESMMTVADSGEVEQIKYLLKILGQDEDLAYLQKTSILPMIDFATKYFRVFMKITAAARGE